MSKAKFSPAALTYAVDKAKAQILADVARGVVPASVSGFAELHDYVDANEYGGAFEGESGGDENTEAHADFWNKVQNAVHKWIVAGGLRKPTEAELLAGLKGIADSFDAPHQFKLTPAVVYVRELLARAALPTERRMRSLADIKETVLAGYPVHWQNSNYRVTFIPPAKFEKTPQEPDCFHWWYIVCETGNGSTVGLTWSDGETLNGKPEDFYTPAAFARK